MSRILQRIDVFHWLYACLCSATVTVVDNSVQATTAWRYKNLIIIRPTCANEGMWEMTPLTSAKTSHSRYRSSRKCLLFNILYLEKTLMSNHNLWHTISRRCIWNVSSNLTPCVTFHIFMAWKMMHFHTSLLCLRTCRSIEKIKHL